MAPLAIAVMGMIGTAGAAAATAGTALVAGASTLAGTVGTALAGSATALGSLQGAFTIASAFGSIASGMVGMAESEVQARGEKLQAEREALAIRDETLKKIGDNRVAFGASGVTLASSDPVEMTLYGQTERETTLALSGGRLRASQARARGNAGMLAAATDALGSVGNYATSVANRGGPAPAATG
jgi:hypothetical protein